MSHLRSQGGIACTVLLRVSNVSYSLTETVWRIGASRQGTVELCMSLCPASGSQACYQCFRRGSGIHTLISSWSREFIGFPGALWTKLGRYDITLEVDVKARPF